MSAEPVSVEKPVALCLIATSFPRFPGDGAGIFLKNLLDHLGRDVDCDVLAPDAPEAVAMDGVSYRVRRVAYAPRRVQRLFYAGGGVPQQLKRPLRNALLLVGYLLSMTGRALLVTRGKELVHAHWIQNGLFGLLPRLLWRCRLVVTVHGSDMKAVRGSHLHLALARLVLGQADAVITVNRALEAELRAFAPRARVHYLPNGVTLPEADALARPERDRFEALFVGNLVPEKGLNDLRDAYDGLVRRGCRLRLTIVGSGALEAELRRWAERHAGRVVVRGALPHEAVLAKMDESSMLVLPSHNEGRPTVVLEAMAAGLPVLASALPGIREVIEDGVSGRLIPAGDVRALSDALERSVAGVEPLAEYAARARRFIVDQRLTWRDCARDHLVLYRSLREAGRRP